MKGAIVSLVIGIVLLAAHDSTDGETRQVAVVTDLLDVVEENGGELKEWRVYTRGITKDRVQSKEDYRQLLTAWQSTLDPTFVWALDGWEHREHWTVSASSSNDRHSPFQEHLVIRALPKGNDYSVHLSYTKQGSYWNDELQQMVNEFEKKLPQSFTNTPQVFTTVVATHSQDDLATFATKLLQDFSANIVEELREESFMSISAYHKHWKHSIETSGKEMNLQLALRQDPRLGTKTTVTLGTPIITNEY